MLRPYIELLNRIKGQLRVDTSLVTRRLNVPEPDIVTTGNRTILRNFSEIARSLNRDPRHVLMKVAKELGTAMTLDPEGRAIIFGKKDMASIKNVINYYIKLYVLCPVCGSPDTKLVKERKITFIVCEACGARTPIK